MIIWRCFSLVLLVTKERGKIGNEPCEAIRCRIVYLIRLGRKNGRIGIAEALHEELYYQGCSHASFELDLRRSLEHRSVFLRYFCGIMKLYDSYRTGLQFVVHTGQ